MGPAEGGERDVVRVLPDGAHITKIEGNGIYYYDLGRPHAGEKVHRMEAEVPEEVAAVMTATFKQNAEHILTGRTARTLALGEELSEDQVAKIIAKELAASHAKAKLRELAAAMRGGTKTSRAEAAHDMGSRIRLTYAKLSADPEIGSRITMRLEDMKRDGDTPIARMVRATWGEGITPSAIGRSGSEALASVVMAVLNDVDEPGIEQRFAILMHNDIGLFEHLHA